MCIQCQSGFSRRGLMFGAAALAGACLLRPAFAADDLPPGQTAPNAIPGSEALDRLMAGNARYVANTTEHRDFSARRQAQTKGQYPIAAVLGCSDSRVSPELCFDQGPGDVFVVRVAGNVADNDGLASLEYAVAYLGVPLVVVLGHTSCGAVAAAVKAATQQAQFPGHLPGLIKSILPAVEAAKGQGTDLLDASIVTNARLTAAEVAGTSPIIGAAVASGKVKLATGIYELGSGKVTLV